MPSPFVVAPYKMTMDVLYTQEEQANELLLANWDLPAELRPNSGVINRNMLGYDCIRHFTAKQFESLGQYMETDDQGAYINRP